MKIRAPICLLTCLAALTVLSSGCSASGQVSFAKFSPDGDHLVYEDAGHPCVYVYYPATGRQQVLPGFVVCLDKEVRHLVLAPPDECRGEYGEKEPVHRFLVTIDPAGIRVDSLPMLKTGYESPFVLMEIAPDQRTLHAWVYEHFYDIVTLSQKVGEPYRLTIGDPAWVKCAERDQPPSAAVLRERYIPVGSREGRYCFAPYEEFPGMPYREYLGRDVEPCENGMCTLAQPGGKYVLRINDTNDPWHRLTILDTHTGTKRVLLDKNDLGIDAARGFHTALVAPAILVLRPN